MIDYTNVSSTYFTNRVGSNPTFLMTLHNKSVITKSVNISKTGPPYLFVEFVVIRYI